MNLTVSIPNRVAAEYTMKETAAAEAKDKFGELLEIAKSEPVAIEDEGRQVAVLLSFAEYQRLIDLEDRYWGEKAVKALDSGFVAEPEATEWLKKKLSDA